MRNTSAPTAIISAPSSVAMTNAGTDLAITISRGDAGDTNS